MNLRDLRLRVRALMAPRRVERELDEELAFHIERETQKHVAAGLSLADARARARARFGSPALAAEECRDARGTAFIDTAVRDISYALRTFRRAPLTALTIVGTVSLGLALVAVVFTVFNAIVFRVDTVPNLDELFAVERLHAPGAQERARFTRPEYEALRRESGVFSDAFARLTDLDSRIDGRMMAGALVTGNFFQVLGVNPALGRALTPDDDLRHTGRTVMVLSHTGWSRLFAGDRTVVGRSVLVSGFPYEIVGVMPEGFRGLAVGAPDYWAPLALLGQFRPIHAGREEMVGIDIVGRLKPGVSRSAATAGLAVWASGQADGRPVDARTANIRLEPRKGTIPLSLEVLAVSTPVFFAFGLILLIGCANVASLLLARAVSRQREIGIRLSLGASRRRVVRQLLSESLLLALAAAAGGFAISRLLLDGTLAVVLRTLPPEMAEFVNITVPGADWRMAVFLVVAAVGATGLFGLAPALQATRLELVRIMRGEVTRDARPGRARNVLIAAQVTASALLLICAAVFLRSALRAATVDHGFRTTDTVAIDIVNEPRRTAMVQAVAAEPSVAAVAAAWPDPLGEPRAAFASGERAATRVPVGYRFVSDSYFHVLDIGVRRGRAFTQAEAASGAAVAVVSETTARQIWPHDEAIGQVLRLEPDPHSPTRRDDEPALPSQSLAVVGVVRDVAGFRFGGIKEAGIYVATSAARAETSLMVRVHGDPEVARHALLKRLITVDPNMGQVVTMRTLARMETYVLQVAFCLALALGGLALVLTLSGIFSVLSYLVEQRTKEIGVRMALGASTRDVTTLVLSQSARPVGLGLMAGAGLAVTLATVLMSTPAAAAIGASVRVFDPFAYAASLMCIVAACVLAAWIPARRAARINPMAALRRD